MSNSPRIRLQGILIWLPAFAIACSLRQSLLQAGNSGYDLFLRQLDVNSLGDLHAVHYAGLFAPEVWWFGLLLPLALALATARMRLRYYLSAWTAASLLVSIVLFIELKTFWQVGTFLPFSVLVSGLHEGAGAQYVKQYVYWTSFAKLGATIAVTVLLAAALGKPSTQRILRRYSSYRRLLAAGAAACGVGLAICQSNLPSTPYSRSLGMMALGTFGQFDLADYADASVPRELHEGSVTRIRIATALPPPDLDPRFTAKARDYNVLFIVLETMPQAVFESDDPRFGAFARLRNNALISEHHYTTYPYTVRAVPSLYSSWYPSNAVNDHFHAAYLRGRSFELPGIVRTLAREGYDTQVFVPEQTDNFEHDRERYEAIGFNHQRFPIVDAKYHLPDAVSERAARDEQALQLLRAELAANAGRKKFCYAFHPQVSHGPWPGVSTESAAEEMFEAGKKLLAIEDRWIGTLTADLERLGVLDRTLIVITGDHGIRTRNEHPAFRAGVLDDLTFHVPLLIYAPGIAESPAVFAGPTSHVDISPTLERLMGFDPALSASLGVEIWNNRIAERKVVMFARNYLGLDGVIAGGKQYMHSYFFDWTIAKSWDSRIDFAPSDFAVQASPHERREIETLKEVAVLQDRLVYAASH